VYFIFKELYAKDETDPICRYTVDIYNMPVPDSHYIKIIKGPMVSSDFDLSCILKLSVIIFTGEGSHYGEQMSHEVCEVGRRA
jgi:hypothetical protein